MSVSNPAPTSKSMNNSKPINISQSKLSKQHGQLATKLETLLTQAQKLGAREGAQRIALICDQYDKLSPDVAYQWIDPIALQQEVEEAQARKVEAWHLVRNCASLFPLVLTWFALFFAARGYQKDLVAHANDDKGKSFLELWQNGFHNTTFFTFSIAALTDVFLLLFYLSLIIFTYLLDRRAQRISNNFAQELQGTTQELMQAVTTDGITPLASDADIDKVASAVQRVVDKAVEMNKQIAQASQESIEQIAQSAQQSNQQTLQAVQQSVEQAVQSAQQSSQQSVQMAQQSIEQVAQTILQSNQQAMDSIKQTSQEAIQASRQSVEQVAQAIQQSNQQAVQAIQQASQQILQTAQQAIAASNSKVEDLFNSQVMPMMNRFNNDMTELHRELSSYQERLDELTNASKQLSNASTTLVANADRYIRIGQEISDQITSLNTTQQEVLTQIGAIAGNISSAAKDMSAATTSMSAATNSMSTSTKAVEAVATQMTTGMQITINTMTTQVGRATQSLGQVGNELYTTTQYLQKAAMLLSSLQLGSGGGFIGWILRRRSNRRRGVLQP